MRRIAAVCALATVGLVAASVNGSAAALPSRSRESVGLSSSVIEVSDQGGALGPTSPRATEDIPREWQDPIERMVGDLADTFPTEFGGYSRTESGEFIVYEVDPTDPTFESTVQDRIAALGKEFPGSRSSREPVPVTFEAARFSWIELTATQRGLAHELRPPAVWGVGIDARANQVILETDGSSEGRAASTELLAKLIPGIAQVEAEEEPLIASGRLADTPPWNGGDRMVPNSERRTFCTSGPLVHSSNGHRYIFTAGHCIPDTYYNTVNNGPNGEPYGTFNSSTQIGSTLAGSRIYDWTIQTLDSQLIDPGSKSSSCFIWGGNSIPPYGSLVRYAITGSVNPGVGLPVKQEGSNATEVASTVVQTNYTYTEHDPRDGHDYQIINGFKTNGIINGGDSGGPVISLDPYFGPLVVGMMTSGLDETKGEMINSLLYSYQVTVNTSPTGYSC